MNETTTQLHPSFLTRMQHLLGPEYPAFLASFDAPRTYGLRLNTSKITSEAFEKLAPFSITPTPGSKTPTSTARISAPPDAPTTSPASTTSRNQAP